MESMTEKENMLAGELYNPMDSTLVQERMHCKSLLKQLNVEIYTSGKENSQLIKHLLPNANKDLLLEPPFYCEYGYNISCGKRVFINVNCVFLDAAKITIGNYVMFGPGVQLYTSTHPLEAELRQKKSVAKPIVIGDHSWLGGNCIVLPGIQIGAHAVVAAGAVVTRDVPPFAVVAGNPAKVIKQLTK